jgi:hypothetical protein
MSILICSSFFFEILHEILIGSQPADKEQRLDMNPDCFQELYLEAGVVLQFYRLNLAFDKSKNPAKNGLKDLLNLFSSNQLSRKMGKLSDFQISGF